MIIKQIEKTHSQLDRRHPLQNGFTYDPSVSFFIGYGINIEGEDIETRLQMGLCGFVGPSASPWGRLGSCWELLKVPREPR